MPIKLIVGLGNPGDSYTKTRHNVGFWLLEQINTRYQGQFKLEAKFFGEVAKVNIAGTMVWLLKPNTFMNLSGKAIGALAHFYKISPDDILVLHDELDLPVGTVRLKTGGGHGGHNGLRDTISVLGSKAFHRIRIGIDHPGNAKAVANYVLKKPSVEDKISLERSINNVLQYADAIVDKDFDKVMNDLHSKC